ncbi:hypothetical protein J6590_015838 [Homalodisca vitripennis]|nr:hypothetical protein J6590_015838 [Homalodisca vitripennis]
MAVRRKRHHSRVLAIRRTLNWTGNPSIIDYICGSRPIPSKPEVLDNLLEMDVAPCSAEATLVLGQHRRFCQNEETVERLITITCATALDCADLYVALAYVRCENSKCVKS